MTNPHPDDLDAKAALDRLASEQTCDGCGECSWKVGPMRSDWFCRMFRKNGYTLTHKGYFKLCGLCIITDTMQCDYLRFVKMDAAVNAAKNLNTDKLMKWQTFAEMMPQQTVVEGRHGKVTLTTNVP